MFLPWRACQNRRAETRARRQEAVRQPPREPLRDLAPRANYPVEVAAALKRLAAAVDERIASSEGVA